MTRWITIGEVRTGHFIHRGNSGWPGGFHLRWVGRVDWCQPCDFLLWEELFWAVERRLLLAGLELVALACALPQLAHNRFRLLVQVRRLHS